MRRGVLFFSVPLTAALLSSCAGGTMESVTCVSWMDVSDPQVAFDEADAVVVAAAKPTDETMQMYGVEAAVHELTVSEHIKGDLGGAGSVQVASTPATCTAHAERWRRNAGRGRRVGPDGPETLGFRTRSAGDQRNRTGRCGDVHHVGSLLTPRRGRKEVWTHDSFLGRTRRGPHELHERRPRHPRRQRGPRPRSPNFGTAEPSHRFLLHGALRLRYEEWVEN